MASNVKQAKTLQPNIGISDKNRTAVSEVLNARLSDTFVLYAKLRKYHWNVTGIHFHELHELFEEQYHQLEESMDEIAERIRQVGGFAFGTLDEFKGHTALEEQPGIVPKAEDMLRDALADHETVIRQLRKDITAADEEYGDIGTSDFLTGLLESHEKMAWMLRAHLDG